MQIGVITKPQALKGQFRMKPMNISLEELKSLDEVIIKGSTYMVEKVISREGFVIMQVEGIDDISKVEPLRNVPVYIEDVEEDELGEDEYYIEDLLQCKLQDDLGAYIGEIVDVKLYGGASVITVKTNAGEKMFPHARNVILSLDIENKVCIVDRKIYEEISL